MLKKLIMINEINNNKTFCTFEDIELIYPIEFNRQTSNKFESDIVHLFNTGELEIDKCLNDSTGILFNHLGNYHSLVNNNREKAIEYYNQAILKNVYEAYYNLALETEDKDEKIRLFELSLSKGNESSHCYFELGKTLLLKNAILGYTNSKSLEKQTTLFLNAANKNSVGALYFLGVMSMDQEKYEDAKKYINSAIELYKTENNSYTEKQLKNCEKLLKNISRLEKVNCSKN